MPCSRCNGLSMVDWVCVAEGEFTVLRCVSCGNIIDPVIVQNREKKKTRFLSHESGLFRKRFSY